MGKAASFDAEYVEKLVTDAAEGKEAEWRALWQAIEPKLDALIAQPRFLGPVGKNVDDRRNIIVDLMARLREDKFHRLSLYIAARAENPRLSFWTWLRIVAKRVGIDYLRAHPQYIDRRRSAEPHSTPGRWIEPGTLPPSSQLPGERPHVTLTGTAAELLRHAGHALPAAQRQAIELWLQSHAYDEIARRLGLENAGAAERLVRAGIERLRREFRSRGDLQ